MSNPRFKITVEGTSQVTILSLETMTGWLPLARFYAGRADDVLLRLIETKLNEAS